MRTVCFILIFLGFRFTAIADHITGGEMYYRQTGSANGQFQYAVTLKLFKNCRSNRQLLNPAILGIFDRQTGARIKDDSVALSRVETLNLTEPNKCITNPPDVCFEVGYYEFSVSLPASASGYTLSCQVSFRVQGIDNMQGNYGNISATYAAEIPATPFANNNSAIFTGSDLVAVCANNSFSYSFAAQDSDDDELRYSFCNAFQGGFGGGNASSPAPPPYNSVPYGSGYNGSNPLGSRVTIDSKTGLIKGVAPGDGIYVVTVCVEEIRNGIVIATQRKDLQLNIASCTIAAASLLPEYLLCTNSSTLSIANNSSSPLIKTYNWELVNNKGITVYKDANPGLTYNFKDTGLYKIKLAINKDLECSDSMESVARVYPGMVSDFDFSGICFKKPTQFINKSTTVYGQINVLSWNFGEGMPNDNEIALPSPSYQYASIGNKNPQLVVNTTTGCRDTVLKIISIIEKPPLKLGFRDTLVCVNDNLTLLAEGNGNFSWSPAVTLTNSTTANPLALPQKSTTYFVSLDDNGCINQDSLKVRVVDRVSLRAMNDTIICQGDTIQLNLLSDALSYSWSTGQNPLTSVPNPIISAGS
ncbi:MAG TPA: hypothetical protein VM935_14515, partial [Chitinophagaceae bacterium]|nr:hypothetical protein [Chitinophagaceae bacterium]